MAERTIGDIIEAAKSCEPATDEELRLALCAVSSLMVLHSLAPEPARQLWYHERMANERFEARFRILRAKPSEYLGPQNTPGNPEYVERRRISNALMSKIMDKQKDGE